MMINNCAKGSRIVIPEKLERAVSITHEGHQGLVRKKQLLREKVWFPGIDKYVKTVIDTCIACQANSAKNRPEPLQMSQLPQLHGTLFIWIFVAHFHL